MLRVLLVDKDQPVFEDVRFAFVRIERTSDEGTTQTCCRIAQTIAEQPPFDLIVLAHGSGSLGFAYTTEVPREQRSRVVIMSANQVRPNMVAAYSDLGVTQFSGREEAFAQFVHAWAAQRQSTEPPTDPGHDVST